MGCSLGRIIDPRQPDPSIRYFWHISGVFIDDTRQQPEARVQTRGGGVIYVFEGRLFFRSRCCSLNRKNLQLEIGICDIERVALAQTFRPLTDPTSIHRGFGGPVVDVIVNDAVSNTHFGFKTDQAEQISIELNKICMKHRQKPKIFQFNSIDVEGVEIDLP